MAAIPTNNVALVKAMIPLLDEIYRNDSLSKDLNAPAELVRDGANANEILVPKMDMDGLGDYSRTDGYKAGGVSVSWETIILEYDRGRKFLVDAMDNQETANIAFARLASEFVRTKVIPEADAYTFSKICADVPVANAKAVNYSDAIALLKDINAGSSQLDELEVPVDGRVLYITPTLIRSIRDLETIQSREALAGFTAIVPVPQSRFYTAIDLLTGDTGDEFSGGYAKATAGKDINFLIVSKPSVIKFDKHVISGIIPAAQNPDADADLYKYRKYGTVATFANKVSGLYLSRKV